MKRPTRGKSGRNDNNRRRPPLADYVAPSSEEGAQRPHQKTDNPDDQFHEGRDGTDRPWKRNMRRPEPITPENSWLATQPEFRRYWGEGEQPDQYGNPEEPQVYDDHYGHPPEPAGPQVPKPRRKPADISTLMARYTAKTEEDAKRRLPPPPPLQKASPSAAAGRQGRPRPRGNHTGMPQSGAPAPARPAPSPPAIDHGRNAPKNQITSSRNSEELARPQQRKTDPSTPPASPKRKQATGMGISALPSELPKGEPAALPTPAPSLTGISPTSSPSLVTPEPAPGSTQATGQSARQTKGSFVVTDGQVKLVESSSKDPNSSQSANLQSPSTKPNLRSLTDINQTPPQISGDPALSQQANDNSADADVSEVTNNQGDSDGALEIGPETDQEIATNPENVDEGEYSDADYADSEHKDDDYALIDPEQQELVPFSEQASMQNPAYADVAYGDDDYVDGSQIDYEQYEDDPNVWQSQGYVTQGYDSETDARPPVDHFDGGGFQASPSGSPNTQHWPGEPQFEPSSGSASDANWNALGSQGQLDPAWHGTREQDRSSRSWPKIIFMALVLGGAGYGAWAYGPEKLVNTAATFVSQQVETFGQLVAGFTKNTSDNEQATLPGDAVGANPAAESTTPTRPATNQTTAPLANNVAVASGTRLAPDPSMKTRQLDDVSGQSTTLWWRAKTVTQFPALTEAELAGQPQPTTPTGEAVMAPTGPLEDLVQQNPAAQASSANDTESTRIARLIADYQITDASAAADKLIAANSSSPGAHILKGQTNLLQAQYLEALTSFDRALNNEPQNVAALVGRGNALVNLGRAIEAQQIAGAILATTPGHKDAMWLNAEALGATGKLEAAMQICDGIGASGASISEAEWCRGVANKRARRPLQTEANFASALQGGDANFISHRQRYFRFKGYYDGDISGTVDGALMQASTRCAASRDCDVAGL